MESRLVQLLLLMTVNCLATAVRQNVWAAVSLTDCNAPCNPGNSSRGTQTVNFGCYERHSPNLMRLTGTEFYLANSTRWQLPASRCAVISLPPPSASSVPCRREYPDGRVITGACSEGVIPSSSSAYWWQLDAAAASALPEAACEPADITAAEVAECGRSGVIRLRPQCRRRGLATIAEEARCLAAGLPRPGFLTVPCRQLRGCHPVWKAGAWGACSRDCGLGETARTVECSQLIDSPEGPLFEPAPGKCSGDMESRPHSREYCVVQSECPPYYRLKAGKCLPRFSPDGASTPRRWCNETGLQTIRTDCAKLVGDAATSLNQTRIVPDAECRRLQRPERFQPCRVDAETLAQRGITCVEPNNAELLAPPKLLPAPSGSLLVQMERLPLIQAQCGEWATLIPGTELRLHCGVANFKAGELRWRKLSGKNPRSFKQREQQASRRRSGAEAPTCGRVCIANNGDLVFRRFKPRDAGTYEVSAGTAKAQIRLRWHTAYQAYIRAYLPRAHLLRRSPALGSSLSAYGADMPLLVRDTPGSAESLAWMTGAWSDCPCGPAPSQRRRLVRCERLRSGLYSVVEDSQCLKLLGSTPTTVEACGDGEGEAGRTGRRRVCPVWLTGDWDRECSVSHCYLKGVSLTLRSVTCKHPETNATLADSECQQLAKVPKPDSAKQCQNRECQPEWSVGDWSACSKSCGTFGFRSRQVRCLWRGTARPAGLACESLPLPRGHKACYEGPCHRLGCVDLLPACKIYQASALCAHPSLRKSCCSTCSTYDVSVYKSIKKGRL